MVIKYYQLIFKVGKNTFYGNVKNIFMVMHYHRVFIIMVCDYHNIFTLQFLSIIITINKITSLFL